VNLFHLFGLTHQLQAVEKIFHDNVLAPLILSAKEVARKSKYYILHIFVSLTKKKRWLSFRMEN